MKKRLLFLFLLPIVFLVGCTQSNLPTAMTAWLTPEEIHPSEGTTITVSATPLTGATYQYEILDGENIVYARQGPQSSEEFEVEWWPWACRVTVFAEGEVYDPITLSPVLKNKSPVIARPKLAYGEDWYINLRPLQEYILHFGAAYDQYGNELGVRDPDGDDWHIVDVVIQEELNPNPTTVITYPYQKGVWSFGPYEDSCAFWPCWAGEIHADGRPYTPAPYGQGYHYDPSECDGIRRNLSPHMDDQDCTITVTVEDVYGAQSTATFTIHIGDYTCN